MRKELLLISMCMIFVVATFGCSSFLGGGSQTETKLSEEQGLGVIGTLKVDEMHPGLDGYLSLTIRNNLGGESASNVYVSLDNVEPFQIFECGAFVSNSSRLRSEGVCIRQQAFVGPTNCDQKITKELCQSTGGCEWSACSGTFGLDSKLPYRIHGESKMFPGEELEFFWRLKAPTKDEISNIALRHPIYYDLEFDYRTTFVQNIIFMSQQEVLRRRQAQETYSVEGEASSGAGELKVSGITQQPIIYFFRDPTNIHSTESDFYFALQYSIKNQGSGIPRSDVITLIELPKGKFSSNQQDIEIDSNSMKEYGWFEFKNWDGLIEIKTTRNDVTPSGCYGNPTYDKGVYTWKCNCNTGTAYQNCTDWIKTVYGNEYKNYFDEAINENRLLVKVVKRNDFINEFQVYLPLKIVEGSSSNLKGMYALKNLQIPIQIYGFKVHNVYRYFTEESSDIVVYPIRI